MKFDKGKVYTALNADEVKVGSKGYVADNIRDLCEAVDSDAKQVVITNIEDDDADYRFVIGSSCSYYALFYLVEEPQEKKFRPYKDTDEMIEDFKRRYNSYGDRTGKDNPMYFPLIWIKRKDYGEKYLVNHIGSDCVGLSNVWDMGELFKYFTYLDGTPCGMEE